MNPETYVKYLESVVLSLLAERGIDSLAIEITDPQAGPGMVGHRVAIPNLREEISQQRLERHLKSKQKS